MEIEPVPEDAPPDDGNTAPFQLETASESEDTQAYRI